MSYPTKRSSVLKRSKSKSMDTSGPTVLDLPGLRRKRTLAFNRMKKTLEIAQIAKTDPSNLESFLAYHSSVAKLVDSFEEAHADILSIVDDSNADDEDVIRANFDDMYFSVLAIYRELVPSRSSTTEPSCGRPASRIKLPKIELPKFSGNIKEWPMFYDTFQSLIHKNLSLSDSDRMQYLRSSLYGDALGLIRTFPVEGKYYEEAYKTLVARYRDTRELAFTCWKEMLNINLKINSPTEFRRALDLFNENLIILKSVNLPIEHWDFVLCYHLLSKLDTKARCAFEETYSSSELPSYDALKEFLYSKCEALVRDTHFSSSRDSSKPHQSGHGKHDHSHKSRGVTSSFISDTVKRSQPEVKKPGPSSSSVALKCTFCSDNHSISHCKSFSQKSVQERRDLAKQKNWCFNCLKTSHILKYCKSIFNCQKCGQKHHTLLHQEETAPSDSKLQSTEPVRVMTNIGDHSVVMLSTAVIQICDVAGNFQSMRALIDSGSQAHFITDDAVSQLGLVKSKTCRRVRGLGQSSASVSGIVQIKVGTNDQVAFNLEALTIPSICGSMPSARLNKSSWLNVRGLNLADPDCDKPGPIDVLLGAEVFSSLILPGSVSAGPQQPSALNSIFGWLLLGNVGCTPEDNVNSLFVSNDQLLHEVKKLWELDSLPNVTTLSLEEQRCEDIYRTTTARDPSGRYIVALPFREDKSPSFLGSRDLALLRFHSLERKLSGNRVLREQYSEFMADYLNQGHMSPVPAKDLRNGKYYIPHHCILRPDSATTKLRVVFDASAKDAAGVSLNETLLIGPKMQANILEILLRFRIHPVVFSADVRQMYRQILVGDEYRDYQRIFWRFNPAEPLKEYRLNTVTYGVSSAPFLACRTVQQLVEDEGSESLAKSVLSTDVFVDDVVSGCSNLEQAIRTKSEVIALFQKGHMELRKWSSNKPELLSDLPPEHCLTDNVSLDVETENVLKILGLKWDSRPDQFFFEVKPYDRKCSKRTILSELARIYDPLGFLSPLTFIAKHLVQKLWVLGVSWDEEPPEEIQRQWKNYLQELPLIGNLKIPRCLSVSQIDSCEIHGFSDSSELGYGAVIYLRILDKHGQVKVFFVCSKSRVTPIKKVSLPRLELCAAVLLADVLQFVENVLKPFMSICETVAWSDSTVTLSWIRAPSSRWKTFVANRVSHIQDTVPGARWGHVSSADNPADIASRGCTPADLVSNSLWWAGPPWLACDKDSWPSSISYPLEDEVRAEERIQVLLVNNDVSHPIDFLLERYSSIRKVQRVIGVWLRYMHNLRNRNRVDNFPLNKFELHQALLVIVKRTQSLYLGEELIRLKEGKPLSKPMRKLNLFVDDTGVLRVGGRLARSGLEYCHKHPALLPRQAKLTDMIIDAMHRENCHPGINTLHYLVSQQFWILSAKRVIRNRVSKCVRCFKTNPTPLEPFMSDLPAARVNQVKPFSVVGVDYAGPFRIKSGKYRGAKISKAYLCLFVCFTTKAVHLEVATDLSTDSFIAALRRFVGRRGRVSTIYSDCGTNFVGASRELSSLMKNAAHNEQIEFKFNPPSSPHFGGIWEIQVKAVKSHFYRIVGTQALTLDELFTLFVQIESVLNSRPLYPLSADPNDFAVLTPGHFLTLEPLTSVPDEDLSSLNINRLGRWQLIQRFQRDFWKRWKNEYLQTLTQRAKWTTQSKPLEVGSVVILKTESPPLHWPIARVEDLHKGPDGVIRVATLRLPNGSLLTRPLAKVCPLPSSSNK